MRGPPDVRRGQHPQRRHGTNPTKGLINIEGLDKATKLTVVDLTGKTLYEEQINGRTSLNIDIQQLNQGIYFVVINQNSGIRVIKKIVKQ